MGTLSARWACLITSLSTASALLRPAFNHAPHILIHRHNPPSLAAPPRPPPPLPLLPSRRPHPLWRRSTCRFSSTTGASDKPVPISAWQYERDGVEGAPLAHSLDAYNSAWVKDAGEVSAVDFGPMLTESLDAWRVAKCNAVWLRLQSPRDVELLPIAVTMGFAPHHASSDHITLNLSLREGPSRLPPGPSHFVGVAGMVFDAAGERVLVVQEGSGPQAGKGLWKMPGGLVDQGEDLGQAAVREVLEETGVETEFVRLVTVMENHRVMGPGREGSTDLYCVCLLRETSPGQQVVAQASEIAACQWMHVADLASHHPLWETPTFKTILETGLGVRGGGLGGMGQRYKLHRGHETSLLFAAPPGEP